MPSECSQRLKDGYVKVRKSIKIKSDTWRKTVRDESIRINFDTKRRERG